MPKIKAGYLIEIYYLSCKNNTLTDNIVDEINKILPIKTSNYIFKNAEKLTREQINKIIVFYGLNDTTRY